MAAEFLTTLDPSGSKFTFQFFADAGDGHAELFHGSLNEVWPRIIQLNIPQCGAGVFVTINETDLKGRRRENIVRPRSLFVDADSIEQVKRCREIVLSSGAEPTMTVVTSPGRAHLYWCCDDIRLEEFSSLQAALIEKFDTDPAIKDASRVMRLPGTLHLKELKNPIKVTLLKGAPGQRWKVAQLSSRLNLVASPASAPPPLGAVKPDLAIFTSQDSQRLARIFGSAFHSCLPLRTGITTNLPEISSAVRAIPAVLIASEPEWVKLARGLAHEGAVFQDQAEKLWDLLDAASATVTGYDYAENRQRWERYIREAFDRDAPITIATVFDMARRNGWRGWAPEIYGVSSEVTQPGNHVAGGLISKANLRVTFANLPHRRWLYGVDLVRGEITLLAAPGGVGKSSLAIGMSVALATGRELLGERVTGKELTALYINAEDSGTEMQRRIWAFCIQHNVAESDLDRLLLLGADTAATQSISFLRTDKGASVLDLNGLAAFEAALSECRPDVVVLDPLVALCGGGNLNDNASMSLVLRALKRLATSFDCALLVLHHTRKGGDLNSAEAIGGASAIVNLSRRALMAVPMQQEEATRLGLLPSERFGYFKVVASKSNLAMRVDDAPWYHLRNVTLPNAEPPIYMTGDGVQAISREKLSAANQSPSIDDLKIKQAILETVENGKIVDGTNVRYSPNTTGARNERAFIPDAMAAVQAATTPRAWHEEDLRSVVGRAVERLKADGWLKEEEIKVGRFRRGRGLKVDWVRTPWPTGQCMPASAAQSEAAPGTGATAPLVNGEMACSLE